MLVLTKLLLNQPIMSLRTGGQVATAIEPIIDPTNLKIEGFYCIDNFDKKKRLILVYRDIRDVLPAGIVVDDHSVLAEPDELVRLKKVISYEFQLIGKVVVTNSKKKLGKVVDYATEPQSMFIQKLYVMQPFIKNLNGGSLSIDRNQIVEISRSKIIVKDPLQPLSVADASPAIAPAG